MMGYLPWLLPVWRRLLLLIDDVLKSTVDVHQTLLLKESTKVAHLLAVAVILFFISLAALDQRLIELALIFLCQEYLFLSSRLQCLFFFLPLNLPHFLLVLLNLAVHCSNLSSLGRRSSLMIFPLGHLFGQRLQVGAMLLCWGSQTSPQVCRDLQLHAGRLSSQLQTILAGRCHRSNRKWPCIASLFIMGFSR